MRYIFGLVLGLFVLSGSECYGQKEELTQLEGTDELLAVVDSAWSIYGASGKKKMVAYLESFDAISANSDTALLEYYYAIIIGYGHLEMVDKQFEKVVAGIKLAHKRADRWMLLSLYRELASINDVTLGQFEEAEKYFKEALKYLDAVAVDSQIGLMMDLALAYTNNDQLDSARVYFDKAFELLPLEKRMEPDLYSFSAPFFIKIKEYDKAEANLTLAYEVWESKNRIVQMANTNVDFANLYYEKKQFQKSLDHATKSIELLVGYANISTLEDAYEYKAKSEKALGLTEESLQSYILLNNLKDSIDMREKDKQIAKTQLEFVVDKYKTELDTLQSSHLALTSSSKLTRNVLTGLAGILVFSLLGFYVVLKRRRERFAALTKQLDSNKTELQQLQTEYDYSINELEKNKRELTSTAMLTEKKDEALNSVRKLLSKVDVYGDAKIVEAIKSAKKLADNSISVTNSWESFLYFFDKVYPSFITDITKKYPQLNSNDLRSLAYLKMGLTDKEVSRLQGINTASFQKAKYRLKKKLEIESDRSLDDVINTM